eukprot:339340-Pyramimonas_sp.AAC.1
MAMPSIPEPQATLHPRRPGATGDLTVPATVGPISAGNLDVLSQYPLGTLQYKLCLGSDVKIETMNNAIITIWFRMTKERKCPKGSPR